MKPPDRRSFPQNCRHLARHRSAVSAYPTALAKGEVGDLFASLGKQRAKK